MTRHAAYALHATGRPYRHPFATFPHADAARRWLANHPGTPVRFVPPLPATAEEIDAAIDRAIARGNA